MHDNEYDHAKSCLPHAAIATAASTSLESKPVSGNQVPPAVYAHVDISSQF